MKAEQLWASILQEAIQGKLVPQLESEPEVNQIGEVPEDVPFTVPKKWKWMPLKNVGRIVGGGTPKTSVTEYWKDGTIVWFTPADLGKVTGVYASDSERKITELGLAKSSAVLMPPNSIIFSSRAPIGYIAVATKHCCTNQGCKSFVPDLKVIDSLWGYFAIRARTPDIIARASGTTFKEISGKEVGETLIPIPPLLEQQRIVKRLIEIQTLIDSYGKEQEALEELEQKLPSELKASLLQEAIRGKLVPQLESEPKVELQNEKESFEIPFEIPSKWKWTTLEQICLQITDGEHKTPKYQIGGVPFLSVKDISSKKLNFSNTKFVSLEDFNVIKKRCYPQKGDILLSKVGSTGIPAIIDTDKEFALFVSVALLKLNKLLVLDKFLWYLLQSPLVQKQAKENTRGIGNKNWVLKAIKATMVPLPPILEQHRIVDQLEKIFSSINSLSK